MVMSDKIREAMEKMKCPIIGRHTQEYNETIDFCIKAYEDNKPSIEDVIKAHGEMGWVSVGGKCESTLDTIECLGLLRKPPKIITRWQWTDGELTTNNKYSEDEFQLKYPYGKFGWYKVKGSEEEQNINGKEVP